jgi:cell division protein FtsI/penicillin-binding protein 2
MQSNGTIGISRTKVLLIGLLAIGAIFIFRLFYLQVIKHDFYYAEAQKEYVTKLTIPAKRGLIYAKDGPNGTAPLVLNETVYTAYADPYEVEEPGKITDAIRRIAGGNVVDGFEAQLTNRDLRYTVLARQLNRTQAELLKGEELAGVGLQEGSRRVYPEGKLGSQLLGFVDGEGEGRYGLEQALEDRLNGTPGLLNAVTDVRRIPLTIGENNTRIAPQNGDDLVLTIDRNIQGQAEEMLRDGLKKARATEGSVVVMDPRSGAVLAMANYPTYDPARFSSVKDYGVFQNKVVSFPYEAGSVIKTLTMGSGLDGGAITSNSKFYNTGTIEVDGVDIDNVEEDPVRGQNATMLEALKYSLNTGMVHIVEQMGGGDVNGQARNTLYDYFANRFLLGKPTGIEQAGEQRGTVLGPNEGFGRNVRYANMAFGQGMDVTMIQVAAAFSASINGGKYWKPHLVEGTLGPGGEITKEDPKLVSDRVIKQRASQQLKDMTWRARSQGFLGSQDRPGYMVGGKTGTSQIIDPETGGYTDDNSIGTYLGFGADGDGTPRYVIMVRVQDSKLPGYAGTVAAGPIFADISNWLLDYLKVQPLR